MSDITIFTLKLEGSLVCYCDTEVFKQLRDVGVISHTECRIPGY